MVRRQQSNLAVARLGWRLHRARALAPLIGRLLAEHDEDAARLGGYLASSGRARLAAEEPVSRRLLHRLPWLLVGLVGAMASAMIVGAFEAQLDEVVLLAFFVPAVVYMADAVGTQTETLLIRGMSASIDMRTVVRRELITGVLIGVLIGLAFFPFALIGWGDADVALAVALGPDRELLDRDLGGDRPASLAVALRQRPGIRLRASGDDHPGPALDRRLPGDRDADSHLTLGE